MGKIKVVIADDEERICQLICALVDWDGLGLTIAGIAHNGLEALTLVKKLEPEILITDIRMPGCSGMELIEQVKETAPDLEIVIISGYAHFEYAQQAIRFGVGRYLLKPISKTELTETLIRLQETISARQVSELDKQELLRKSEEDDSRIRRNLVGELVDGTAPRLTREVWEETYHFTTKGGWYQAFCVKVDCEELSGGSACKAMTEKICEIAERTLRDQKVESELIEREYYCYGIVHYDRLDREEMRRVYRSVLSEIEVQQKLFGQTSVSMAVGSACSEPEHLPESMREAAALIRERIVRGSGRLLEHSPRPSAVADRHLLERYLRDITKAVEVVSVAQADEAAAELKQEATAVPGICGGEILELVLSAAGIFAACAKVTNRSEAVEEFRRKCEHCNGVDRLFSCLQEFQQKHLQETADRYENDRVRPVRKAKEYIQAHYSEPLTQEEISEMVGLTPTYFSALFKKTEGEGFARYLIGVRMEQAKILLRESNLPVTEICRRVGYNDLKHFTHTFEKTTGVKPSMYRKLYG